MKTNVQKIEGKINQDTGKLKEDVAAVVEDGKTSLGRFEAKTLQTVTKAKDDLTSWMEEETSQLSRRIGSLAGEARDTMIDTASTVKKDVGHGLIHYNARAQEVAEKVPGGFSQKATSYPWVAISIALVIGFMLGGLLKPARRFMG